MYDVALLASK